MDRGLLAEFETPEQLADAVGKMRDAGFREVDVHVPFADGKVLDAVGSFRSPLPAVTLVGALFGGAGAYLLMWWTQAVDYPINVGGRPDHALPAFIPITFETMVLFGGLSVFFAWMLLSGLPKLWRPIFEVDGFETATVDRWWLRVDATGDDFDFARAEEALRELGPLRMARFGTETEDAP